MNSPVVDPYTEVALGVEAAWPASYSSHRTQQAPKTIDVGNASRRATDGRPQRRTWLGPLLESPL